MTPDQLKMLLSAGVKHGASDIHLRVGDPPTYRVRGQLAPLKYDKLTPTDTLEICQHLIRDADTLKKLAELQEYDTSYSLPGVARFRVNVHRQRGSLSIILRIIPSTVPTIEELGLPDIISKIAEHEPALRQDPDVILVGEMRDAESVDIALKASETGHMVFSTVHTTDAAKTVGRLLGVFPPEEQPQVRTRLADNLKATISQRLLPRIDGKGRAVAAEVMIVTGTVQDYLRDPSKAAGVKDLIEKGFSQYGMQSFDQHLAQLYRAKVISMDTAVNASSNPSDFQRSLHFE